MPQNPAMHRLVPAIWFSRAGFLTFISLMLMLAVLAPLSARAAEAEQVAQVTIPPAGLSSSPAPLVGFAFRPQGGEPHPAVIMLHGCGGAYANNGQLNARHRMWGEFLAERGYFALMLDSFTSRGIKELCTLRLASRPLTEAGRVGDAYAALAWLREQQGVDPKRIVLLGWSHGAGVTLDAMAHSPTDRSGFRAAVAFYPSCSARSKRADRFHPYAPLLVLMGESDDWTPAAPCVALASAVSARGEPMQIVTYPATYHDFDNPGIKTVHVRREVPNGVHPGQGVTTAPNPTAREDAKVRVLKFFSDHTL